HFSSYCLPFSASPHLHFTGYPLQKIDILLMNKAMKILTLKISLFVMGLSSITAQIILLRELLVSFLGNELTLGIILASWLILVAAGSFLIGKSVENVERKLEIFAVFQLIFSIAFPFAIFFCRIFKNILLATPGEALGFGPIFYSSLLILLPLTVPYGPYLLMDVNFMRSIPKKTLLR
ncbi:MAG: hypothetical protein ACXU9P_13875, partial [Thermodesulfobacteriota bacterium]